MNLILFTLVAGVTTTAAYTVYGEVLLHPDQISARFSSWFLALLAALTFAVATLGINVVANFVSPAFDFSNVFPRLIDFKKGGYIAALIALVLYPFAPWQGERRILRRRDRRDDGADLRHHDGRLLPDPAAAWSTSPRSTRRMANIATPAAGTPTRSSLRHRRPVLQHPAQLHALAAVVVGRLWLVLRRGDRRRGLLCAGEGARPLAG